MTLRLREAVALFALIAGATYTVTLHDARTAGDATMPDTRALDPRFEIRIRRGTLDIRGHTRSAQHERRIRQALAENYPDLAAATDLRPLGLVPDWWSDATLRLLAALATMRSPTAVLRADSLRIEAVVADRSAAESRLDRLRDHLPESVELSASLTGAGARFTARELCARQVRQFSHGPVNFEESGVTMRSSAYPVLERVVALADACRDTTVAITGHTDSSGSELLNRQLSEARAAAVADYLAERGIAATRLVVVGAGSSVPIADNATRFGRSLNRRIDIRLSESR